MDSVFLASTDHRSNFKRNSCVRDVYVQAFCPCHCYLKNTYNTAKGVEAQHLPGKNKELSSIPDTQKINNTYNNYLQEFTLYRLL